MSRFVIDADDSTAITGALFTLTGHPWQPTMNLMDEGLVVSLARAVNVTHILNRVATA
jgi:hypothetical protein